MIKTKIFYIGLGVLFTGISVVSGLFVFANTPDKSPDMSSLGVIHHLPIEGMLSTQIKPQESKILELSPIITFQKISENLPEPTVSADSAIVIDFATGDVLYQKNPLDRHQLASITKLLTAIVALEEYQWNSDKYISMTQTAFDTYGGNSLQVGEQFKVEDIMRASLMMSSNDAAQLLAEQFGGTDVFVAKMNQKAMDLNMEGSKFFNSHGLDQKPQSNYSTAADIVKLTQYIYDKHPELMEVLRQRETTITSQSGQVIRIGNTNELLGISSQMIGAKTGLTNEAGETLSSVVSIKGRVVGIVVLQSDIGGYRFQDTQNLIKWVEDNYSL